MGMFVAASKQSCKTLYLTALLYRYKGCLLELPKVREMYGLET